MYRLLRGSSYSSCGTKAFLKNQSIKKKNPYKSNFQIVLLQRKVKFSLVFPLLSISVPTSLFELLSNFKDKWKHSCSRNYLRAKTPSDLSPYVTNCKK